MQPKVHFVTVHGMTINPTVRYILEKVSFVKAIWKKAQKLL